MAGITGWRGLADPSCGPGLGVAQLAGWTGIRASKTGWSGDPCEVTLGTGCAVGKMRHVIKRQLRGDAVGIGGVAAAWRLGRG